MNWKLLAVTLVALAWGNLAFCGEIHDAAKAGDLDKVKALLNANPNLISSKDTNAGRLCSWQLFMAKRTLRNYC
jgi:hypothetical protein